ncbi:hypothetical protein M3Y99_00900900 [Aphelenchoides fujianensis]|nr:hypothetical protein M3Y99_00900900 [Aphelenchoides fujianensis]
MRVDRQPLLQTPFSWRTLSAKFLSRCLIGAFIVGVVLFELSSLHQLFRARPFFPKGENASETEAPPECYCRGELFCFPGVDSNGRTKFGRPFPCNDELLAFLEENRLLEAQIQTTPSEYERLDADEWTPTFFTSISADHFAEGRTLIGRLRKFYPDNPIVMFDLGLNEEKLKEVRGWCNVEIRPFVFDGRPAHLRHLRNFAFKLVLLEALKTHKAFFYFDTSVLIQNDQLNEFLRAVQSGLLQPFSTHTFTYHSTYAATNPKMYDFLPIPAEALQMEMVQSTAMLVVDSPYTRRVMKWWALCAMTPDCLTPEGSEVDCEVHRFRDRWTTYMKCHRFDQSFWNIYAAAELFGPQRVAVRLGYSTDFDRIDRDLAKRVEKARNQALKPLFKRLIAIKRGNPHDEPLDLPCAKE